MTHSAQQVKGLVTLGHASLSLSFPCSPGWVVTTLGRGSKDDTVVYWVDREQTFPGSQSGMNWLCDSVTNCMVVWDCPGQPVTPTVHWGQVVMGGSCSWG